MENVRKLLSGKEYTVTELLNHELIPDIKFTKLSSQ